MKNKKGFTLIELLAVIVILAIIMVIAIPQILNVIDSSRQSAWRDNVQLIAKAIKLNATGVVDPTTAENPYTISGLCTNTGNISKVVEYHDTNITCSGDIFRLSGTGQFDGKSAKIDCSSGKCSTTVASSNSGPQYIDILNSGKLDAINRDDRHASTFLEYDNNKYWFMFTWERPEPADIHYTDKIIVNPGESYTLKGKVAVCYNCSSNGQFIVGFSPTTAAAEDFVASQTLNTTFSFGGDRFSSSMLNNNSQNIEVTINQPGEYYVKAILKQTSMRCSARAAISELSLERN